jgi:hypothetical protein
MFGFDSRVDSSLDAQVENWTEKPSSEMDENTWKMVN